MDDYSKFIAISRYARWLENENRRETWEETVQRLVDFYSEKAQLTVAESTEIFDAIHDLSVMPSMRALMTAGKALDLCNVAGYNCAYLPVDSTRSFDEAMYILLCGTGVGYSVERNYIERLPVVPNHLEPVNVTVVVPDSKAGWAASLRELIDYLYIGRIPSVDYSRIRPAGARLKTFGGRASGPEPLKALFEFTVHLFKQAVGRKLTSLECHDLMCKIADTVVVGGVRRSAMISLSNVQDDRLRHAKSGAWWEQYGHRRLANNSAVYQGRPDMDCFINEWKALYDSKSGERGIFNRDAAKAIAARNGRRNTNYEFGTNPCSEIILRPFQFCNLTEVVVRATDTAEDLARKVRLAGILGTIQSTFTNFKYLRKIWKDNCEEERLLGVSLTGILDHPTLAYDKELLEHLRSVAVDTNQLWAARLGVNPSTAVTCVKPSGTVSQLVNSASGLHPRWAPFYLRTVRADNKDPLTEFMKSVGIPNEPDRMAPNNTTVFTFPQRAPTGARTRSDLSAIDHLEVWKTLQEAWCEHKPSITVNVKEDEWMKTGAWVYENFDVVSGIAFLPYSDINYPQAPYQEITEDEYNEWIKKMPAEIDWTGLRNFEFNDHTEGSQEFACTGGVCEIVSIGGRE